MFFTIISKVPIIANDNSSSKMFKIFVIGAILYILLHYYLFIGDRGEIINKYKNYIYYVMGIDFAIAYALSVMTSNNDDEEEEDDNEKKQKPNQNEPTPEQKEQYLRQLALRNQMLEQQRAMQLAQRVQMAQQQEKSNSSNQKDEKNEETKSASSKKSSEKKEKAKKSKSSKKEKKEENEDEDTALPIYNGGDDE